METDDQGGQEPDDDKPDEMIGDFSGKILSVKTEESILQEASKKIEDITKAHLLTKVNSILEPKDNDIAIETNTHRAELEKQVLIGEITPFEAAVKKQESQQVKRSFGKASDLLDLEKYLKQQAELAKQRKLLKENSKTRHNEENQTINPKKSKIQSIKSKTLQKLAKDKPNRKRLISKTRKAKNLSKINDSSNFSVGPSKLNTVDELYKENENVQDPSVPLNISKDNTGDISNQALNVIESTELINDSGSEYIPSDDEPESEDEAGPSTKSRRKGHTKSTSVHTKRILDDGDEDIYRQRVEETGYRRKEPMHKIDNLFKVPQSIWKKLYRYQRVSVQWLWELHGRNLGGLLGDEMGLGKTVQVIAFLAGLDCSELLSDGGRFRGLGPTIIVCPATLMEQWVKHFHEWWPTLRIVILHQSGTYGGNVEYLLHSLKVGGVLITSYSGVLIHKELLVATQWHYIILDEGHKIRNPQAKVSRAVKEFSTPHRLLLTGSPMQNSLKELWSLFDFILPGKLGTLPAFLEHCASPITRGGYANATPLQEATALQVATMLKDAITPYMLRRTKNDVQHHVSLPEKNEQILFCSLSDEQKKLYKRYLRSEDVSFILQEKSNYSETGRYKARLLIALSALRKICNHPDLFLYTSQIDSDEDVDLNEEKLEKFGCWKRAGKMTVVRSLLKIWKKQGHRVLLFTQGRQMMHILESLVQKEEYTYLRMDGTTPMSQRQQTIWLFNDNPTYFVFLLTTRVGGLGVNLTGANRVIIYDPDWNPATDAQARERAWRIGQNKRVTIYRLITAGTIEEKIYHRQIFKLLLSNRVLEDPRQRRLFKTSDLAELFNLNEPINGESSESEKLFRESKLTPTTIKSRTKFSSSKIEKMRKLAATLSKSISRTLPPTSSNLEKGCDEDSVIDSHNHGKNTIEIDISQKIGTSECGLRTTDSSSNERLPENELVKEKIQNNQNVPIDGNENMLSYDTNEINILENTQITSQNDSSNLNTNDKNIEIIESTILEENQGNLINENKKTIQELHKKNHKHKRRKKNSRAEKNEISAVFEGERVSCLIGRRLECSQANESASIEDDQYVLKKLFAKATVSSAFQHDAVLSNAVCNLNDKNPMQRLARESAQESMENVRKSRKWCWKPTWESTSAENEG